MSGFACLPPFFVLIRREGAVVQRPGSCLERDLELEHVTVLEQYLSVVAVILQVAGSGAWASITGRVALSWGQSCLMEMEKPVRRRSASLGEDWRMSA